MKTLGARAATMVCRTVKIPKYPRIRVARGVEVRKVMNDLGLKQVPIVMAGGVWYMQDWVDWIDDPDIAPVAFQFGTRPLLTQESPISDQWKKRLLGLEEGDVFLNKYSPTGSTPPRYATTF